MCQEFHKQWFYLYIPVLFWFPSSVTLLTYLVCSPQQPLFSTALFNYSPNSMYFCSWIILQDLIILLFICYPGFRLFGLFSKIILNFKVVLYHGCLSCNTEIHNYSILLPKLLMKMLNNTKPTMKLCDIGQYIFPVLTMKH